jgi:hypothetical protein
MTIVQGVAMSQKDLPDLATMTAARVAFLCARLNLRNGKRQLQKGLTVKGALALYDSVLFGMRYYITYHKRCASFVKNIDLWDAASLFHALTRAGVFDDPCTFNHFSFTVERALWQTSISLDVDAALAEAEGMLAKLGVLSGEHPAKTAD